MTPTLKRVKILSIGQIMNEQEQKEATQKEIDKYKQDMAHVIEQQKIDFEKALNEATEDSNMKLSASVLALLREHAFFGHLVQNISRKNSLAIPTAGVTVINNRFHLLINPFFFSTLDIKEAKAVIKHELYHLLNDHLKRVRDKDPKLWNVAADMAINCYIDDLPRTDREEIKQQLLAQGMSDEEAEKTLPKADKDGKFCTALFPEQYNLPRNRKTEYYYAEIIKNDKLKKQFQSPSANFTVGPDGKTNMTPEEQEKLKEAIKNGKVQVTFGEGDHEDWGSVSEHSDQILDEELKRIIQEAKNEAPRSFGSLHGDLKEQILEFLTSKVNWKAKLRSWVQHATQVLRVNTRKRASRRFGISYQGQKSDYKLNLGVYVDSSGSICEEELKIFGGEINKIFATGLANVEIMVGDTKTHEHYKMKRKMSPKDFKVSGRGGTCADSWVKYINQQKLDAVVILTDGWFDFDITKPKVPLMWTLTSDGYDLKDFERHIKHGKTIKLEREE